MATRQTRLYYNTGFNVGNTPGTLSILNTASYLDLESHWDYQDYFLGSIRLKATYDQVKNADYLKYGNAYYWITGISMINMNNAELSLELDALATMGGAQNIRFKGGVIKRAHPNPGEDGLFNNLLPEPIGPNEELQLVEVTDINNPGAAQTVKIILSTVSLETKLKMVNGVVSPLNATATEYKVLGEEVGSVITPEMVPPVTWVTSINGGQIQGIGYYIFDNNTASEVSYLRSLGIENAIVGCYSVPQAYINVTATNINIGIGQVRRITSITSTSAVGNAGTRTAGKTSRWKKTLMMNNNLYVMGTLTGEVKKYKMEDLCRIYSGNTYSETDPKFKISADVNINGKPYISPQYFGGRLNASKIYNGMTGIEWLTLPVVANGASGSLWVRNDYVRSTAQLGTDTVEFGYNALKDMAGNFTGRMDKNTLLAGGIAANMGVNGAGLGTTIGGLGTMGSAITPNVNVAGVADSGINALIGAKRLMYAAEKLDTDFAQMQAQEPYISSAPAQGLQLSLPNAFTAYHYMMTDDDIEKINNFFDWYGYAQNKVFDPAYLNNRNDFNYIQVSGIHVSRQSGANYGIAIKDLAEKQMSNGVRIWHKLPN